MSQVDPKLFPKCEDMDKNLIISRKKEEQLHL